MKIFSRTNKGFTLIELLVVIAIIGILAGIVLVSLGGARTSARDARRQSDIRQIATAQELYYNDSSAYVTGAAPNAPSAFGTYLVVTPLDPSRTATTCSTVAGNVTSGSAYCWVANASDSSKYCVYAVLEKVATTGKTWYFVGTQNGVKAQELTTLAALPTLGAGVCQ